MTRYGTNVYNTFTYGEPSGYNNTDISPFTATAVDYDKVVLSFTNPVGITGNSSAYKEFRIVRNQNGIPDTAEDGVVIYRTTTPATTRETVTIEDHSPTITRNGIVIATTLPKIVPGQYAYYGAWLFINTSWVLVGTAETLVADKHSTPIGIVDGVNSKALTRTTHEKLMDLLPRVFTSSSANAVDVVDYSSVLSNFLLGFSYTIDEITTFADLLSPQHSLTNVSKEFLDARSVEMNVPLENRISTKFQRQLLREINWIYSRKGTSSAFIDAIESMTGFSTTFSTSPNLMLSVQDSTFIDWRSYADWKLQNQATITGATADGIRITYTAANKFKLGQAVTITGITPTGFNIADAIVVAASSTTFTVESSLASSTTYSSGGVATLDVDVPYTFWRTEGACTLSADLFTLSLSAPSETYAIDKQACGAVVATAANTSISYGNFSTITRGIPVIEGSAYSLSFYAKKKDSTTSTITPQITWYGYDGSTLYSTSGSAATATTSWARSVLTATAPVTVSSTISNVAIASNVATLTVTNSANYTVGQPITVQFPDTSTFVYLNGTYPITAKNTTNGTVSFSFTHATVSSTAATGTAASKGAAFAGIRLTFSAINTYYVDMFQLAVDSTGTLGYYEPRACLAVMSPNKTNFISEPAFENAPITLWTVNSGVTASQVSNSSSPATPTSQGAYAYQVVNTSGTATLTTKIQSSSGLISGTWYTFSIYAKASSGTSSLSINLAVAGTPTVATATSSGNTVGTGWTRIQVPIYVPSSFVFNTTDSMVASVSFTGAATILFDCAMVEFGYGATDYFDGSFSDLGGLWTGTAHHSPSFFYNNYYQKAPRINRDIKRYLPSNTPYYVFIQQGATNTLAYVDALVSGTVPLSGITP